MIHKTITLDEAERLTGRKALCVPQIVRGVFEGDKLIAIYSVVENNEVCLAVRAEVSKIRTWKEIKKGLHLLNELGYVNLKAEAGQKYLNKLGLSW